ncbi:hypothetical protein ACS0TY_024087 [Phlomoides rotata]
MYKFCYVAKIDDNCFGAKSKVGFIDGSIVLPAKTSPEYVVWKKVDCMVVSWILSSISKDLARTFAHTKYVKCI